MLAPDGLSLTIPALNIEKEQLLTEKGKSPWQIEMIQTNILTKVFDFLKIPLLEERATKLVLNPSTE